MHQQVQGQEAGEAADVSISVSVSARVTMTCSTLYTVEEQREEIVIGVSPLLAC